MSEKEEYWPKQVLFWEEWVKDLKIDLAYYKKLARERGELNVKLAYELDAHKPPTKSDEELNALKEEDKSMWICTACGKSTYETEYDYLASRTLHLECALKEEISTANDYPVVDLKTRGYRFKETVK